ncbi:MAG: preprotein translocase subunit YajC [Clostridia bacterium]|nr:preprotein translocase subunit YajC [Clostridia bacterium]
MANLLLAEAGAGSSWWVYVILLVAVVALLVFPFFTQKKRNKQFSDMVSGLEVGDEVKTIGGIMGKIVKIIKENGMAKSVIIESGMGSNKSTLEFDVTCIAYSLTEHALVEEKKEEAKVEEKKEESDKKEEQTEVSAKEEVKEVEAKPTKKTSKKSK